MGFSWKMAVMPWQLSSGSLRRLCIAAFTRSGLARALIICGINPYPP